MDFWAGCPGRDKGRAMVAGLLHMEECQLQSRRSRSSFDCL